MCKEDIYFTELQLTGAGIGFGKRGALSSLGFENMSFPYGKLNFRNFNPKLSEILKQNPLLETWEPIKCS